MKKITLALLLTACGSTAKPQPTDTANLALVDGCAEAANQVIVDKDITADETWTKDKVYRLGGVIAVQDGTLTIEAGTVVQGTVAQKSALIVTASGKLNVAGTSSAPVVFTSCKPVGERSPGDWGGVALLGKAVINTSSGTNPIEGLPEDERFIYGGQDDTHSCGSVKYARFEFAGQAFQPDKELNSFTLAGCGSATVVDYVQAHLGKDDLIEFFGGTVNVSHLVLTHGDDDGFDWQLGYRGRAQFVLFQQFVSAQAERGIEADNSEFNQTATPYSSPILANTTFIGAGLATAPWSTSLKPAGAKLRRGTRGEIINSIFTEFNGSAIEVSAKTKARDANGKEIEQDDPVIANANDGSLKIDHVLFFHNKTFGTFEQAMMSNPTMSNMLDVDPMLLDPLNQTMPNAKPALGSPVLSGAVDVTTLDPFFVRADFIGAIGAVDWTLGWTAYPIN